MRRLTLSVLSLAFLALYEFRQALGQEVVVTRGDDEVGLNSELFWCDVSAFEAAVRMLT